MTTGRFGFQYTGQGAVKIEGLREVQRALKDLSDDLKNEMKSTHLAAANAVLPEAQRLAPFRTGALSASLRASATRTGGRIRAGSASTPYAGPIHFGWPARSIRPQPFVYEALDPRRDEVIEVYAKRLNELIEKYGIASDKAGVVFARNVG
jgi:HK97 gp10 family phage protein